MNQHDELCERLWNGERKLNGSLAVSNWPRFARVIPVLVTRKITHSRGESATTIFPSLSPLSLFLPSTNYQHPRTFPRNFESQKEVRTRRRGRDREFIYLVEAFLASSRSGIGIACLFFLFLCARIPRLDPWPAAHLRSTR